MKTFIKLVRVPTEEDKLGPQVKAIMTALNRAIGADDKDAKIGVRTERKNVIDQLTAGKELVTRQDPARILSFYQPQLIDKGIIAVEKEAEEKPKAEPKTAPTAAGTAAPKAAGTGDAPKPAAADASKPAASAAGASA